MTTQPKRKKSRRVTPPQAVNRQDTASRIGANIKRIRFERMGLTVETAAKRVGMSAGAYSEIENGKRWRKAWFDICRLAAGLGCKPGDFFDDTAC